MERVRLKECWAAVPGYEGLYEVSDRGCVRSCPRKLRVGHGRVRFYEGKVLSPAPTNGYPSVHLYKRVQPRSYSVHCLVLTTFEGPCPDGMEACHNNGVKTDNRLTNLRWDTPSSNQLDRQKHGTFAPFGLKGESHHFATLTDSQVLKIREEYAKGNTTQTALAKQYSVSQHTISNIVLEKTRSTKRFV